MQPDLIPTSEAAELLGVSTATINRWVSLGRLTPAIEIAGRTGARFYHRSDITKLLDQRLQQAETKVEALNHAKQAKAAS